MPKVKALVLFSGGLDSTLAVKILELQDIEVTGLCFTSNFFSSASAEKSVKANDIKLKVVDINKEILDLVKNPPSGYGKNLNPCIDCHSLMIKKAGQIMKKEKYDFVATGEVLGQRPFSQNKDALERVKKISGVDVLRPLSAKLLPETEAEKKGLVNRGRLLNISGRMRERQMELAAKFKITYPAPAGGCLLTDPEFSGRLIKMLNYWPKCNNNDVELLKNGRPFWLNKGNKKTLLVVGRNATENSNLEKLAKTGDIMIELNKENGPTTLIRNLQVAGLKNEVTEEKIPDHLDPRLLDSSKNFSAKEIVNMATVATGYYATKARGKNLEIKIKNFKL
jgi:tRNA-uridine 2-sulfurtransferase